MDVWDLVEVLSGDCDVDHVVGVDDAFALDLVDIGLCDLEKRVVG